MRAIISRLSKARPSVVTLLTRGATVREDAVACCAAEASPPEPNEAMPAPLSVARGLRPAPAAAEALGLRPDSMDDVMPSTLSCEAVMLWPLRDTTSPLLTLAMTPEDARAVASRCRVGDPEAVLLV